MTPEPANPGRVPPLPRGRGGQGVRLHPLASESHIMGMPQASATWTAAQIRLLPEDGKRYEVVAGELLVTPAPGRAHQRAVGGLFLLIATYLESTGRAEVLFSP